MPPSNYDEIENNAAKIFNKRKWNYKNLSKGEKIIALFKQDNKWRKYCRCLNYSRKSYEGLDAPRCKHLVCLTRQRSVPWLLYFKSLEKRLWIRKKRIINQRCWIFAPRDKEMVDAVDRIVWDQDLISTNNDSTDKLLLEDEEFDLVQKMS